MLDTMTFTKAVGALCGALLVFLLGAWAAEVLYSPHGSHGEQAYVIDTGADSTATAEPEETADFATLYAAADPAAGERLWRQCASCHALEKGKNGTGPYLYGIVGRDKGSAEGFRYSEALASAEGTWEPENISAFIENPRGYLPGTSMAYAGMRKAEDRANLIAYLATFGD
jgi:cytochrome c